MKNLRDGALHGTTDAEIRATGATGFAFGVDGRGNVRIAYVVNGERTFDPGPFTVEQARTIADGLIATADRAERVTS